MVLRLGKIALVGSMGFYLLLVVFNNVTDYRSNFRFVEHVLSMDTTFEGNGGRWRSIQHPLLHHLTYALIIAWEALAATLTLTGAVRLWHARRAPAAGFQRSKSLAFAGLFVGLLLWFVAFITVGGEWFLMWQSRIWNGQEAAFRLFACTALVLLVLLPRDEELPSTAT
jgi:predicted small integral membrane protein